jgi:hypothetical protein
VDLQNLLAIIDGGQVVVRIHWASHACIKQIDVQYSRPLIYLTGHLECKLLNQGPLEFAFQFQLFGGFSCSVFEGAVEAPQLLPVLLHPATKHNYNLCTPLCGRTVLEMHNPAEPSGKVSG